MKYKTTKKAVKENYRDILSVGYCDIQYLLNYFSPESYCSGSYGWACDNYNIGGTLISTGYSPLKGTIAYDHQILREYERKAINTTAEERTALLKEFLGGIVQ